MDEPTVGDIVVLRKPHPCGTNRWRVVRIGADIGLRAEDPTIATALRARGYRTGQFGNNHLGDRVEHLPTNRGFDEFYGTLYHLNAEEEPEHEEFPRDLVLPDGSTFGV